MIRIIRGLTAPLCQTAENAAGLDIKTGVLYNAFVIDN
jgi:hypothetical protein